MRGVSRESLIRARERVDEAPDATGEDAASGELFAVLRLLDREGGLRRVLSDPSLPGERKSDLLRDLLGEQVGERALAMLDGIVRSRWSKARDFTDAVEIVAVDAEVARAQQAGQLDELEDELFRFGRIVAAEPALRNALVDPALPDERKQGLIDSLLADRATAATVRLVRQLTIHPRGRSFDSGLADYARLAAERRERLLAHVRVAVPMSEEQRERLAVALAETYGHQVQLNVEVDPTVVGGLLVQVGDEVIDGTVSRRLEEARRRLAG
ncbi:F0F1 ATP synthase subunit delta [soil metagenome]